MDLDVVLQENRRLALENGRLVKYVWELDKILNDACKRNNIAPAGPSIDSRSSVSSDRHGEGITMTSLSEQLEQKAALLPPDNGKLNGSVGVSSVQGMVTLL